MKVDPTPQVFMNTNRGFKDRVNLFTFDLIRQGRYLMLHATTRAAVHPLLLILTKSDKSEEDAQLFSSHYAVSKTPTLAILI
jgi:hypothetical protein